MCLDVLGHADPDCSELCSLRRLVYSVELASLAPTLRFCPPSPGGPTLQQPRSVTSLVSDWQYLHTWFCPVAPLSPSALAARSAQLFGRSSVCGLCHSFSLDTLRNSLQIYNLTDLQLGALDYG